MSNQISNTDPLTGVLNRQTFEATLNTLVEQAEKDATPFSLALADLDGFKAINDDLGHQAGDAILVGFADVLKTLGEDAIVCRYGGDEFAVLFPGMEREQAFLKLERVRAEIEHKTEYGHGNYTFKRSTHTSIGVAAYPIDGSDANELFRKADAALYRAKLTGRNKIILAFEERMVPKTVHFTTTQLERLTKLSQERSVSEAILLREAMDDLLIKYMHGFHK
ncbi:MAG: diguanylate cyclase [Anaerolineales bacterium]|nr:diguanylate cyclase [Anaerolineales bacterium]